MGDIGCGVCVEVVEEIVDANRGYSAAREETTPQEIIWSVLTHAILTNIVGSVRGDFALTRQPQSSTGPV